MMSFGIRILGYVTILAALLVGSIGVRFLVPQQTVFLFDSQYLENIRDFKFSPVVTEEVVTPEIAFNEIKIHVTRPVYKAVALAPGKRVVVEEVVIAEQKTKIIVTQKSELNFHEQVVLNVVEFKHVIVANNESLFTGVHIEAVAVAPAIIEDKVKTTLAQADKKDSVKSTEEDLDAMFFEYPVANAKPVAAAVQTAPAVTTQKDFTAPQSEVSKSVPQDDDVESLFFDYPAEPEITGAAAAPVNEIPAMTVSNLKQIQESEKATPSPEKAEEVSLNDMMAFDYSGMQKDVQANNVPKVSSMSTHHKPQVRKPAPQNNDSKKGLVQEETLPEVEAFLASNKSALTKTTHYPARTIIQLTSTDFQKPQIETNFEIRFNDDASDVREDYGTGSITLEDELRQDRMTRSVTVLKRGYVPTNNDLILEKGETTLSLPVIEERAFNTMMEPYGNRGFIGAVLVELDDNTDDADLDSPYGKALPLDGDLKVTDKDDYRYKLFLGVRAGNALLTYRHQNRQRISKIIHVHEQEVTFDANEFDNLQRVRVSLQEEELLASGKSSLVTSAERVRVFATNKTAKKINQSTYELDFGLGLLGERNYIELNHQDEPVFVGIRQNKTVHVPSENFMRHVLANLPGHDMTNRCVVQINLPKGLDKIIVGSESVNESLETNTQLLDQDGKFYDSPSDKTKKIIIIGESQGSDSFSRDGRINIKLNYVDGSVEYLGSYCSPNSYLVEQL